MLCIDCERRFGVWEGAFAEQCFTPIVDGAVQRIRYDTWMLKFAVSVSWRVLRACKALDGLAKFPLEVISAADDALEHWADFLLDRRSHPGAHEQHLLLVDRIESSTIQDMPANINRYLVRAVELDIVYTSTSAMTYAKMGRFLLFGFIRMPYPRRWKGTKLNANHGRFGTGHVTLPANIGTFLMDRSRHIASKFTSISDRQRAKMTDTFRRDLDRLANSDAFRALHHEVMMFGEEEAFGITHRPPPASS